MSMDQQVGLQLHSLRRELGRDPAAALGKVRAFGVDRVETAGTYGLAVGEFRRHLDRNGLAAVSAHFPYEQFRERVEQVAAEAGTLGVEYVGCAWFPHGDRLNETECREAIDLFNAAGEAVARHGFRFFYHIHGYEFQPHGDGTLFDLLAVETDPDFVCFELDPFWVVHGGEDPVGIMRRYAERFELLHLKDMKRGTMVGDPTGTSDPANTVALGTGMLDVPRYLRCAREIGIEWYFIEDESPAALTQIPLSLGYLKEQGF